MASTISEERLELFKRFIGDFEPYPISVLDDLMFDDKRFDPDRVMSTIILDRLIKEGYSEEELNPWIKKKQ